MPNPTIQTQGFDCLQRPVRGQISRTCWSARGRQRQLYSYNIYHSETKQRTRKPCSFWPAICPVDALRHDGIGPLASPMDGTLQYAKRSISGKCKSRKKRARNPPASFAGHTRYHSLPALQKHPKIPPCMDRRSGSSAAWTLHMREIKKIKKDIPNSPDQNRRTRQPKKTQLTLR